MPYRWYVAQTCSLAELAAARRLKRHDFTTYIPHMTLRRPERRGRVLVRRTPLFPGYMFVSLDVEDDPTEQWKRVNATHAILGLLPRSDHPEPMPDGHIEDLIEAEIAGNFIYPRTDAIHRGVKLRVDLGPLSKQIVECLDADDRRGIVRALWDCLARRTVVTLSISDVTVLRSA